MTEQNKAGELWAVHAQGPDEIYPAFSKADAEQHAAELNALPMPYGISVNAVAIPSPWPAAEHWEHLAEEEREHKEQIMARAAQPAPVVPEGYVLNIEVEKLLCAKLGIDWTPAGMSIVSLVDQLALAAAPAQGQQVEFGDAYQGAREDLAIWKRRALEAEEKLRQQGSIIDHLTLEAQGETRMGEPRIAQGQQSPNYWRDLAVANRKVADEALAELSALKAQQAGQERRDWPDDAIVEAWNWCEENGGTPAEFLSHSLLVKRSRVLGRPLTWREAIELTALTTDMSDDQRDKLLAMDDAAPQPAPAQDVAGLLEWAVDRWHAEVANRPLQNVHRRSLDDTWRQVIRKLGGDAGLLCGPAHDALAAHDKQSGEVKP